MRERSDIKFPMWRKKVDSSFFSDHGTFIPAWVSTMWNLDNYFRKANSKKYELAKITVRFENKDYDGWITYQIRRKDRKEYRFWYSDELDYIIKQTYVMSYLRSIEGNLSDKNRNATEEDTGFWEFIDLEFDETNKSMLLTAYYVYKAFFPNLFRNLVESPIIRRLEKVVKGKTAISKQDWKPRSLYEKEIGAINVIYTLIDTNNKLIYIGEAQDLIVRFNAGHPIIENWNFYRYNRLPDELAPFRLAIERMIIKDYSALLPNSKRDNKFVISEYQLVNKKIDK